MKQCSLCAHTRADNNLWCQEPCCPAENTVQRLRPGDFVGEMEITKWVTTLPAATIYRAKRDSTLVLLKVAHPGFAEKLKREARFLQTHRHLGLPQLLPAHSDMTVSAHPYGQVAIHGQLFTYFVFSDVQGRTLHEWLARNPQPWHRHTGWVLSSLTDALAFFHSCGLFHFALSPEMILIRFDQKQIPRPVLVDLGLCASFEDIGRYWQPQLVVPGYLAPELRLRQPVGQQTDVYGLGRILKTMLTGLTNGKVYSRNDLQKLPKLAQCATKVDMAQRPLNCLDFGNQLLSTISKLPTELNQWSTTRYLFHLVIICMVLTAIFLFFALLNNTLAN